MRFVKAFVVLVPMCLMLTSCGSSGDPQITNEDIPADVDADVAADVSTDTVADTRVDAWPDIRPDAVAADISDDYADAAADVLADAHDEGPEIPECVPDCTGLVCGADPVCGKPCGVCENGLCVSGVCSTEPSECLSENVCSEENICFGVDEYCNFALEPPLCQKTACADVGSSCSTAEFCKSGVCEEGNCTFQPDCTDRECGPDPIAGVSCGECGDGHVCKSGKCVCVPDCSGRVCGPDPVCGTYCGQCDDGQKCRDGDCVCSVCGPGCGLCPDIQWLPVAGGSFLQGCEVTDPARIDRDCASDELPRHRVTLPSFSISRYEITVDEYSACVAAGACVKPSGTQSGCNYSRSGRGLHPINCVTWDNAVDFCTWAGGRLGSESEWEYAARKDDNRLYPWGNQAPSCTMAWSIVGECAQNMTHPIALTPDGASPFGAEDMAGNVSEWVADPWHSTNYEGAPTDGSVWATATPGSSRVCRGGGYNGGLVEISARNRMSKSMNITQADLGIRCFK